MAYSNNYGSGYASKGVAAVPLSSFKIEFVPINKEDELCDKLRGTSLLSLSIKKCSEDLINQTMTLIIEGDTDLRLFARTITTYNILYYDKIKDLHCNRREIEIEKLLSIHVNTFMWDQAQLTITFKYKIKD